MYEDFYKLTGKPFQLTPNPRFYFGSQGHEKAMAYLRYGLHQGEGFIVITGDVGTGKTTLLGYLLSQLDSTKYVTARLVTTQLDADDTLRMLASAFGIDTRGADKATLLQAFERFLLEQQRRGKRALVLVDEVQNLPMRSLEELRMLSNFQMNDAAPIQFVLLGQPQFQSMIASDDLMQLRQRVIATFHLGPLGPDETRSYIEHRLQLVNWRHDPQLTDDAYARIHHHTGGVPRRMNVLCDRLFLGGMLEELHEIDGRMVDNVAGEMTGEGSAASHVNGRGRRVVSGEGTASNRVEGTGSEIDQRLAAVERLVKVHDRTIKRALDLAASYLNEPHGKTTGTSPSEGEP
jgi:putative secretion ATPase (PEP-CTERM system associated)